MSGRGSGLPRTRGCGFGTRAGPLMVAQHRDLVEGEGRRRTGLGWGGGDGRDWGGVVATDETGCCLREPQTLTNLVPTQSRR